MPVDRFIHPCMGDSEKVARLTDFEFKVWIFYILTADDFGVLPLVASKLQGADRSLGCRPPKQLVRAIEAALAMDLIQALTHQGSPYVWSANWQHYQKIRHPRQTYYPAPAEAVLRELAQKETAPTRELFATFHADVSEAFRQEFADLEILAALRERDRKKAEKKRRRDGIISEIDRERIGTVSTLTHAGARETAKANGIRLLASGVEEGPGETILAPPLDGQAAFRQLLDAYPQNRIKTGRVVEDAFFDAVFAAGAPVSTFALMRANLENHTRSHEWRVKGMVPALDRWLSEGLWRRQLDEGPTVAEARQQKPNLVAAFAQPAPGESIWDRCPHDPKCTSVSRCEALQAAEPLSKVAQ